MLRSMEEMVGYRVKAIDDEIGKVDDFYFDDHSWIVRYVVIDTGKWLPGRRVLITPEKITEPDWANRILPVGLTTDQIRESPGIASDLPVSMQKRIDLEQYGVWSPYWPPVGSALGGVPVVPPEVVRPLPRKAEEAGDPRLRSVREVINYHVQTMQGGVGHVEDFIVYTEGWMIFYLVVDTRNWLPAKKVLVAADWVARVDWGECRVDVDLSRDEVKNGPSYDPSMPVNREYEARLYDFYGRPKYWE